MRTALSLAALIALAGCAVIVVPDDGGVRFDSAFSSNAVQGNGQVAVERREVGNAGDVVGIDLNGPVQVEVRVGAAPSLQVEGDSNLLPMLLTDAAGGTLRVWVEGRVQTANALRVVYTTPRLTRINSNGSGRLSVSGLNGGSLTLDQNGSRGVQLSGKVARLDARLNGSGSVNAAGLESDAVQASLNGSGRLDLGTLRGDTLNLDLHGSGGVHASGAVRSMSVNLHGSGSADLAGLTSQNAELRTYGSGSIAAAVSQTLVADASGSGHVTVYGNPAQRSISGKRVNVMQ